MSRRPDAIALGVIIVGAVAFGALGHFVLRGDRRAFDEWAVQALRNRADPAMGRGPEWFNGAVRDLTALGSLAVVSLLSLIVIAFTTLRGNHRTALLTVLAAAGGQGLSTCLKNLYDRPRPQVPHLGIHSPSFPSGHAMVSACVYLSLAAVLAARESRPALRLYLVGVGALITGLVGLSRVYLGAHYPTDVLGGWLAGTVWMLVCALVARTALRRPADG